MHSSFDRYIAILSYDNHTNNGDNDGATGNGYIKESDYVQLLENHGFKVQNFLKRYPYTCWAG